MNPAMMPNQYQTMMRLQNGMSGPQNELPRKAMHNNGRNASVVPTSSFLLLSTPRPPPPNLPPIPLSLLSCNRRFYPFPYPSWC